MSGVIDVGDWVRIDVDECGAPVGSVVLVVSVMSDGDVTYNWREFTSFAAYIRNVTLVKVGGRP